MHLKEKSYSINIAKGVGNELEEHLLNAKKKIWIISPWICEKYAELLLKKKDAGLDVKLITTTSYSNKSHIKGLKKLIKLNKIEDKLKNRLFLGITTFGLLVSILFILLSAIKGFEFLFFTTIGAIIITISEAIRKRFNWFEIESPIGLKIYKTAYADREYNNEFMHVKSYNIDDTYWLGSVNLTDKGLWNNIESLIKFSDSRTVNAGCDEFLSLYEHPLLKEKRVDDLFLKALNNTSKTKTKQHQITESEK